MENSENSASKETLLNDATKLAIRDEVEERVEHRETLYWKFGGLFVALIVLFFAVLWKVSISEVRETVEKQLAEKEVVKARDRIMAINSAAEDINLNLIAISSSMNTNQREFLERLNQIKKQDNVVLAEDISKLFVVETATNFYGGRKIVLNHEPIPQTVRLLVGENYILVPLDQTGGYFEGNTISFSTNCHFFEPQSAIKSMRIEYVRKSPH